MEDILEKARRLGRTLAEHPRFKAFLDASKRLHEDKAAGQALQAYNQAAQAIAEKEKKTRPVEVAEKEELERLRAAVAANDTVKAFMKAQADYMELMRKVNDAIYGQIAPPEAPAAPGPSAEPPAAGRRGDGPAPPKPPVQ